MASGLEGFLGCPTVIYESELVDFFNNGSVRDGLVVSTVNGVPVEFLEQLFVETFELPVDGLADLSEMPKDKIFDARSIVSLSGEPVSLSGRKGQMKIEYRLLCDIMAKAISVKSGSFNALTVEKFSLLTAVVCGIRMNWAKSIPNLELGESTEFPASKVLTDKTVHRYISFNDKVGGEETADAPPMKKVPKKPAVSKKRPAATAAAEEQVLKKKRTLKKKSVTSHSTLEMVAVAQEAVPIQMVEASAGVPTAEKPAAEDNIPANQPVDEDTGETGDQETAEDFGERHDESVFVPAVAHIVDVETSAADDMDHIIQQVLSETAQSAFTEGEQIEELDIRGSAIGSQAAVGEKHWLDLPYEDIIARWDAERPVVTASDTDEEGATMDVGTAGGDQQKLLQDILLTIPFDVPLPSAGVEITKIIFGKEIKIPGVDEKACYLATLPQIPVDEKGKEILVEKDPLKGNPSKEHYFLICADIDMLVNLRAQVIEAVDQLFHSFSFKKLSTINIEEISRKEDQVLIWGETEITHVALSRTRYILLKYREILVRKFLESWKINFVPGQGFSAVDLKVIDMLSDLHLFVLEELTKEVRTHGLTWKKTCSQIFEGSPRDRGAVISRSNTNTRSSCWIRTMIRVNGTWVIEPCADKWVKIPRPIISCEVHRHRQYDDTLPSVSEYFRMIKKRWADICLEVVAFCSSRSLLPVGSVNFCRGLLVGEPAFRVAFQFLLSEFLNFMLAELSSSESFSHDISMDFADTAAAGPTPDIKDALNQLRASIDQICERDEVKEQNAKVDAMATNLEILCRDAEATKEAISHQLLEFQAQAQENHNILHAQLSELEYYINRGGAAKKREGSSSRPQPPPSDVQSLESGQFISLEETAERIREVDRRQAEAERERERQRRIRRLSGSSKRRRY
ncbi:dystroglycan-like [Dorcoceras hygrometricum]|uniref:Dystroglycan-like n=1 Tax=Dorcoceras hygrometricum TaxID=472368 RepID=A0A2Z7A2Q7_9LAMI|nr:dystroglycan-like [Dorcoceras hygrometricum]